MTKGEYAYPADEFDTVERGSVPRGVHRTPRSVVRRVGPFLLVLVVFPALAYGAVTYWSSERAGTPTAAESTTAAPVPDETPAPTEPPAEPPAETPAETPAEAPAPVADLTTVVVVFNATSTSGLAGKAAAALTDAGWESVTSDNYTGKSVVTSAVMYGTAEVAVTAQAAADALGITTVTLDDTVDGVEIVLAKDYQPTAG